MGNNIMRREIVNFSIRATNEIGVIKNKYMILSKKIQNQAN
jgi:hypothetical protein